MKRIDQWAIEEIGIPQIVLMENAGKAVAEEISKLSKRPKVCVVAYKGNNGGDGFVAARHLRNMEYDVSVFLLCKKEEISGSAKINLDILDKLDIPVYLQKISHLEKLLKSSNVVVDAIFGIGLSGEIKGLPAKAIDLINKFRKKYNYAVVAVDVPSGINAASGKIGKHAIFADLTVTFAYPKQGLLKYPAVKNVGKLVVADIGIPYETKKLKNKKTEKQNIEFFLPMRLAWTHKGDYGRVLVIAGSKNMSGAAYLTARAAIRSGAGLVYLAVPEDVRKLVASKTREIITIDLAEAEKIKANVVAIGPGLTTQPHIKELVIRLIKKLEVACIILDADGLNCIADDPSILRKAKSKIIITPHPGEMSRLTGKSIKYIQQNREKTAKEAARKWNVEVVLKGANTIVVRKNRVYINSSGNPGMASAGVGDVLTGMIAAFKAQGLPEEAAVYVHGLAGDLASASKGEYGMIASDIVEKIPYAIQRLA